MTDTKPKRRFNKPFIVRSEKAYTALAHWLNDRGVNTFSAGRDENAINVGIVRGANRRGRYRHIGTIIHIHEGAGLYERTWETLQAYIDEQEAARDAQIEERLQQEMAQP